jgi:hypothetical protein
LIAVGSFSAPASPFNLERYEEDHHVNVSKATMADPFSIVAASVGLVASITRLSIQISRFCSDIGDAARDMDSLNRQLTSLSSILLRIQHDPAVLGLPGSFLHELADMIKACEAVITEMSVILGKKMTPNNSWRKVSWAINKKNDLTEKQAKLEAHKSALNLTLMLVTT